MSRCDWTIKFMPGIFAITLISSSTAVPQDVVYDVEQVRNQYYTDLAAKEQELLAQYKLNHDTDGNVIKDSQQRAAEREYLEYSEQRRQELMADTGRDDALGRLLDEAGVPEAHWRDTGTPPHNPRNPLERHPEYRGPAGDRDITALSTKQVNDIAASARQKGYTVQPQNGYVYIKELDVVVWDPAHVRIRTPDGDVIRQQKGRSLLQQIDDLHDMEFVAGHDAPGVVQQAKKVERRLGKKPASDTRNLHEFDQDLSKAGHKTGKRLDNIGRPDVVDQPTRDRFERGKRGEDPTGRIFDFGDKPEAKVRKMQAHSDDVARVLRDGIEADQQHRASEIERVTAEADQHRARARAAAAAGDNDTANRHQQRAADSEMELHRLRQQQHVEDMTAKVLAKKNRTMRQNVLPKQTVLTVPDSPSTPLRPSAMTAKVMMGLSAVGKGFGIYDAYCRESADAKREERVFSQANMAVYIGSNLSGITQAVNSYHQFEYELTDGAKTAADAELERYRQTGLDFRNRILALKEQRKEGQDNQALDRQIEDLEEREARLLELIRRRVMLRAAVRAVWYGTQALPVIGDAVGGVQDVYTLTEAFAGAAHDHSISRAIQAANDAERTRQGSAAVKAAREMVQTLQDMHAAARQKLTSLDQLVTNIQNITGVGDTLRDRVSYGREILISATREPKEGDADNVPDETAVQKLAEDANGVVRFANEITKRCQQLLDEYHAGDVDTDQFREKKGFIKRDFLQLNSVYASVSSRWDAWSTLSDLPDPAEVTKNLREDLILFDGIGQTLQTKRDEFSQLISSYEGQVKDFNFGRQRLDRLVSYFSNNENAKINDDDFDELQRLRRSIAGLQLDPKAADQYRVQLQDVRRVVGTFVTSAKHSRYEVADILSTEQPVVQTDRSAIQQLTALQPRIREMDLAVENARTAFEKLKELAPDEPPAFQILQARQPDGSYRLTVEGIRVPKGGPIFYSWAIPEHFEGEPTAVRTVRFQEPGEYKISVEIYQELKNVTASIGRAETTLQIGMPTPPTPNSGDFTYGDGFGIRYLVSAHPMPPGLSQQQAMDWMHEELSRAVKNHPADHGDGADFYINPITRKMVVRVSVGNEWPLEGNWRYQLDVHLHGIGELNSATQRFDVRLTQRSHSETALVRNSGGYVVIGSLDPPPPPETRKEPTAIIRRDGRMQLNGVPAAYNEPHFPGGRQRAYEFLGFTPDQLRSGRITGSLDIPGNTGQVDVRVDGMPPRSWSDRPSGDSQNRQVVLFPWLLQDGNPDHWGTSFRRAPEMRLYNDDLPRTTTELPDEMSVQGITIQFNSGNVRPGTPRYRFQIGRLLVSHVGSLTDTISESEFREHLTRVITDVNRSGLVKYVRDQR